MKKYLSILAAAALVIFAACTKPAPSYDSSPLEMVMPATKANTADALEGTYWTKYDAVRVYYQDAQHSEVVPVGSLLWFQGGQCYTCPAFELDGVVYRYGDINAGRYEYDAHAFELAYTFGPGRILIDGDLLTIDGRRYCEKPCKTDAAWALINVNINVREWD